jgi:hypothetical protein
MTPEAIADLERRIQFHRTEADRLVALANQHEGAFMVLRDLLAKRESASAGGDTNPPAVSGVQEA